MPATPKPVTQAPLPSLVQTWQIKKREATLNAAAATELAKQLKALVLTAGHTDASGHVWLDLPAGITGYDAKGQPVRLDALQCQRRQSDVYDAEVAEEIFRDKGIFDDMATHWVQVTDPGRAAQVLDAAGLLLGQPVSTLDQEAIDAAYFEDKIDRRELNRIVTIQESYALYAK